MVGDGGEGGLQPGLGLGGDRLVFARRPGVVQSISMKALGDAAQRTGATVEGLRSLGEFVPGGAALFRVYDDHDHDHDDERLRDAVRLGDERGLDEDVGFGLRQLVDIASRALSPGVNDPTTAVQVLDQLHDLLRRLATRSLPVQSVVRRDGRVVATSPATGFADYLDLAVDEIHHWGGEDPRIRARLCGLLRDAHTVARPEYRPLIARKLAGWNVLPPRAGLVLDLTPSDVGLRSRAGQSGG